MSHIVYEAFLEHAPGWLPTVAAAKEEITESFRPNSVSRIMINSTGEPLAWAATISHSGGRVWEIHPCVVAIPEHGKGLGRKLVGDIERLAGMSGVLTLWAGTSDQTNATTLSRIDLFEDPIAAIANIANLKRHPYEFWEKVGFTIVGVMPDVDGPGKPEIVPAKRVGIAKVK